MNHGHGKRKQAAIDGEATYTAFTLGGIYQTEHADRRRNKDGLSLQQIDYWLQFSLQRFVRVDGSDDHVVVQNGQ